jgi:IS66 C-terminal element
VAASLIQGPGSKSPAYADYSHWATRHECTVTGLVLCNIAHAHHLTGDRVGIETAKLHGVDPQSYLADVLNKLVNLWPASRLDELLPWAWSARDRTAALEQAGA